MCNTALCRITIVAQGPFMAEVTRVLQDYAVAATTSSDDQPAAAAMLSRFTEEDLQPARPFVSTKNGRCLLAFLEEQTGREG